MELSTAVFLCCVVCLCYNGEAIVKVPGKGNETVPALIMFGDSIVDTGSNNNISTLLKCNFFPYGRDFVGGKPTGRFCNGKVPSDFLADELGINRSIPAYLSPSLEPGDLLTGVNFASGGSGYDPLTTKLVSVIPLSVQMEQFKQYIGKLKENFGEERTNFILSKSLILVVASSNDIANTYFATGIRKQQYDIPTYTDILVKSASSLVKEIYALGGRRIGLFGAPPLGCLPFTRTLFGGLQRECSEEINLASKLFNSKLSSQLQYLNLTLPQARVVYIHIYDPLLDIIQNPTKYGFEVADRGCCGTGIIEASYLCNPLALTCANDSTYVFWDSYHPTERTYQILLGQILNRYINSFS